MKEVVFEERYFANRDEWLYFLHQLGIEPINDHVSGVVDDIDTITILVDKNDVKIEYNT
jgi:hypothetical protein